MAKARVELNLLPCTRYGIIPTGETQLTTRHCVSFAPGHHNSFGASAIITNYSLYIPLSSTSACHFLWVNFQFHLLLYKLGPPGTLASLYPCISPLSDQLRVAVMKGGILGDTRMFVSAHVFT